MFSGLTRHGEYRVTSLDLGNLTVPDGQPMGGRVLPVRAYVITHPGGILLFDTGLGDEYPPYDRFLSPVRRSLEGAFDAEHMRLADVTVVVNCHLHYDHAGGNPLFPGVPIYMQRREHEAAADNLSFVIRDRLDFAGAELRLLDGEIEILPGFRVIPTPGHTPGHQSLIIEDNDGPVVLAGQAAYTVQEFLEPEREPARGLKTASNQAEFLKSNARIRGLNAQRIYFAHDAEVWDSRTSRVLASLEESGR